MTTMNMIRPRANDRRLSGRAYLAELVDLGKWWSGHYRRAGEYRPVNAIQVPLGEYAAPVWWEHRDGMYYKTPALEYRQRCDGWNVCERCGHTFWFPRAASRCVGCGVKM